MCHHLWVQLFNLQKSTFCYYRPQTKFAKVMFSQLSVCPRGGGISVQGGLCQGDPPPRTVACGRYASYWNAFLFICKTCKSSTVSLKYLPQTILFPIVINKISFKIKVSTTIAIFTTWNTIVGINFINRNKNRLF